MTSSIDKDKLRKECADLTISVNIHRYPEILKAANFLLSNYERIDDMVNAWSDFQKSGKIQDNMVFLHRCETRIDLLKPEWKSA